MYIYIYIYVYIYIYIYIRMYIYIYYLQRTSHTETVELPCVLFPLQTLSSQIWRMTSKACTCRLIRGSLGKDAGYGEHERSGAFCMYTLCSISRKQPGFTSRPRLCAPCLGTLLKTCSLLHQNKSFAVAACIRVL